MHYQSRQQLDAIINEVISIYRPYASTEEALRQALSNNVFFVSMNLKGVDLRDLSKRRTKLPLHLYLDAYDRWCRHMIKEAFGRNFHRWPHDQPLSYAFIDFEGSRSRERISMGELLNIDLLHVHAVIALRPGNGQRCQQALRRPQTPLEKSAVGDILIEPFDPARGTFANAMEYFSKGITLVEDRNAWGEMFEQFPRFSVKESAAKEARSTRRKTSRRRAPKAASVRLDQRFLSGQKLGQNIWQIKLIFICQLLMSISGGESGIRTRDTVSRIHTFQACAFHHSATTPR